MRKAAVLLSVALITGCGEQPVPSKSTKAPEDPKMTALKEAIAKTTPQGKAIIEKVQAMKPLVNQQTSGKTLGEIVEDLSKNKAAYNINPIGWEASEKSSKRWKVLFHYQDFQKEYLTAEWEYNPETNLVYPFDMKNSPTFFAPPTEAEKKAAKGAK